MSRVHRTGAQEDLRRAKRRAKRPCRSAPSAPTGLVGEFDRAEGGRGASRIRARLRWTEVTTDVAARPIVVRSYLVEVEYSANGSDWFLRSRHTVSAKDDADPNTKAHLVIRGLNGKLQYRWRVRAVDRAGCRSAFSDYDVLGSPGPEEPPAPTNVTIFRRSTNRIVVDWEDTPDPDDPKRRRDDQDHFMVEWSTAQDFSTIYRRERRVTRTQASLRVPESQETTLFYARVYAVNDHGDKNVYSLPIPATTSGNSDPNATAEGVRIVRPRVVHTFSLVGDAQVKVYKPPDRAEDDEEIIKVTGDFDDPPTGSDLVIDILVGGTSIFGGDTSKMLRIQAGGNGSGSTTQIVNPDVDANQRIKVEVKQVGSGQPGGNGTIRVVAVRR